ncbi:hypothetical protein JTE90_024890 [Oedothorax gibbosus]|uniref:Uncharacterized protein n=1 Tax=Oedothorax gibbosus TaxID=931172 RepID=A0AAV6V4D9_9ARAC|nr:hypothetical protein JTE90_024890 [Oedothorax gibbosus]
MTFPIPSSRVPFHRLRQSKARFFAPTPRPHLCGEASRIKDARVSPRSEKKLPIFVVTSGPNYLNYCSRTLASFSNFGQRAQPTFSCREKFYRTNFRPTRETGEKFRDLRAREESCAV